MKITRIKSNLTVVLEDGTILSNNECTDELYDLVVSNQYHPESVRNILAPQYSILIKEGEELQEMLNSFNKSEYISVRNESFYISSISELSVPQDLAKAIWNAEQNDEIELLSSYLNFWTLCSLNTNREARQNLFWFLNRYGMSISSSGLFVAYRNVVLHQEGTDLDSSWVRFISEQFTRVRHKLKKSPKNFYIGIDNNGEMACSTSEKNLIETKGILYNLYNRLSEVGTAPVYTDGYTGKFRIRIGEPVTMPRERCNSDSDVTCSRGLHVAGKGWLQSNYFGDTGLRVLVNPSDVVAVPPRDSYGKMRVCAYYPVSVVAFDEGGKIIDEDIDSGFEDNFIDMISYVGEVASEESAAYKLNLPAIPELSRSRILDRMDDIKACLALKKQYGQGSSQ
jgi:hypothetical protein